MAIKIRKEPNLPEVPEDWVGSRPEFYIFWALLSLGKKPDRDFTYQSAQMGGRLERGGAVVDFLFYDPPNLAINVQSTYYHYRTITQQTRGQMQWAQLEGLGLHLIFIDEEDALSNPKYFVQEAMEFRDHSLMTNKG